MTDSKKGQIEVVDLTMAYGQTVIQHDLSFTINRGDIFVIMGGSGCGKSSGGGGTMAAALAASVQCCCREKGSQFSW